MAPAQNTVTSAPRSSTELNNTEKVMEGGVLTPRVTEKDSVSVVRIAESGARFMIRSYGTTV